MRFSSLICCDIFSFIWCNWDISFNFISYFFNVEILIIIIIIITIFLSNYDMILFASIVVNDGNVLLEFLLLWNGWLWDSFLIRDLLLSKFLVNDARADLAGILPRVRPELSFDTTALSLLSPLLLHFFQLVNNLVVNGLIGSVLLNDEAIGSEKTFFRESSVEHSYLWV